MFGRITYLTRAGRHALRTEEAKVETAAAKFSDGTLVQRQDVSGSRRQGARGGDDPKSEYCARVSQQTPLYFGQESGTGRRLVAQVMSSRSRLKGLAKTAGAEERA